MQPALIVFHRWLALITSILIFVVAVTGSALVFEGAIDRGQHPELWHVTPGLATVSLDTIVARARAATGTAPIAGLVLSREADRAWVAQGGGKQVFVDPYTGRVLGTRSAAAFTTSLPRRLHVLHTSLMGGDAGQTLVALVTIATLLLVITGVTIWWQDRLWRIRWSASWKRIAFDLHHSLGIVSALVLFVIAASGIVIHYRALGKAIASLDGDTGHARPAAQSRPGGDAAPVSLDSVARVGTSALPGASITFVTIPTKPDQPYGVAMRFPEDRTPGGRSRVTVDRYLGTALLVQGTRTAGTGTAINNMMRSAHTGDILGKPTEVIWLLASIILAGQTLTGAAMWWNGRPSRAVLARQSAAP